MCEDAASLFAQLALNKSKAAVLSVVPGYCEPFQPIAFSNRFPPVLTEMHCPDYTQLSLNELLLKCQETVLTVTDEQAKCIEGATRKQASEKNMFQIQGRAENCI